MAQELNDNKLRGERVKKLEIERAKIAKLGNPSSKATVTLRKELRETQEKLKKAKKRNAVLTPSCQRKTTLKGNNKRGTLVIQTARLPEKRL